jgi:hypothetical protein
MFRFKSSKVVCMELNTMLNSVIQLEVFGRCSRCLITKIPEVGSTSQSDEVKGWVRLNYGMYCSE